MPIEYPHRLPSASPPAPDGNTACEVFSDERQSHTETRRYRERISILECDDGLVVSRQAVANCHAANCQLPCRMVLRPPKAQAIQWRNRWIEKNTGRPQTGRPVSREEIPAAISRLTDYYSVAPSAGASSAGAASAGAASAGAASAGAASAGVASAGAASAGAASTGAASAGAASAGASSAGAGTWGSSTGWACCSS